MTNLLVTILRKSGKVWLRSSEEFLKATKTPSGSGTKDIYKPSWEFYAPLQFIHSIFDNPAETVDSLTDHCEIIPANAKR